MRSLTTFQVILLLTIVVLGRPALAETPREKAISLKEQGNKLLEEGNKAEALKLKEAKNTA